MGLIRSFVVACSLSGTTLMAHAVLSTASFAQDLSRSNPVELYRAARDASFMGDRLLSYMNVDLFPDHLTRGAQKAVDAAKDLAQATARGSSIVALRAKFKLVEESVNFLRANWHSSDGYRSPTTDMYYRTFLESVECMRVYI